ncbi:MAG: anthranilate phosphoribosyltransferase [Sediminibacterium sp.]|nr:anthranilate phosphoribosyltransferase [Sediminibacterium sp.]
MKTYLEKLYQHHTLSRVEAIAALHELSSDKTNPSQIASFITVFLMRGLTTEELSGFSEALLQLCIPVSFDQSVMDVCGTGGDGKNTFNISTLTALVVAACGIPVAKHGNYGVSSVSGSSNVLEYLGYTFQNEPGELKRQLEKNGICFLHAPLFHPALKRAAPVRKELGIKTFFNMLGPLINPAQPSRRLIGVYSSDIGRKYNYLLQTLPVNYAIVHSVDGYDEIATTADVKLFGNRGEEYLTMESLGIPKVSPEEVFGGNTIHEAARLFIEILKGEGTIAQTNVLAVNAGIAIELATGRDRSDCIATAQEAIKSGKAYQTFLNILKTN